MSSATSKKTCSYMRSDPTSASVASFLTSIYTWRQFGRAKSSSVAPVDLANMVDDLGIASLVPRYVYVVLCQSTPYARIALSSLFQNSLQALDLTLITDSELDCKELQQAVEQLEPNRRHSWRIAGEAELTDRETSLFGVRKNLRTFRRGHSCWRKITDPLLLSEPEKEMVLLDPDLYFPNRFQFEETPAEGLLLMWQQPNCLLPPEVVWAAVNNGIPARPAC